MESTRYRWIDALRGMAILAMVIYHGAYDIIVLYGIDNGILSEIFHSNLMSKILHPLFAGLFIYLCGLSSRLSHNNLKRGILLLIYAIILSIITGIGEIFFHNIFISFGILHLMGVCVLLYSIFHKVLDRLPIRPTAIILIILAILSRNLAWGEIGLWGKFSIEITTYQGNSIIGFILFIIGYPTAGFFSSDYFPLIPWSLIYLSGTLMGKNLNKSPSHNPININNNVDGRILDTNILDAGILDAGIINTSINLLSYVGKHTLWIYILHQPILILGLSLILGRLPG